MFNVTYIIRNWYDCLLSCRHDQTFSGLICETLEEIEQFKREEPRAEIYKITNLKTGEEKIYF